MTEATNAVDLSAEAALELEELKQGLRNDAPALFDLTSLLRTPAPSFRGQSISMLADARSYTYLRDALGSETSVRGLKLTEFEQLVDSFLKILEEGVRAKMPDTIVQAKQFCLALNQSMLARSASDVYMRREQSDMRYISNDAI